VKAKAEPQHPPIMVGHAAAHQQNQTERLTAQEQQRVFTQCPQRSYHPPASVIV